LAIALCLLESGGYVPEILPLGFRQDLKHSILLFGLFCDEKRQRLGPLPHEEGKNVKLPVHAAQGGAGIPERNEPQLHSTLHSIDIIGSTSRELKKKTFSLGAAGAGFYARPSYGMHVALQDLLYYQNE
jgi:hypothetical protein